MTELTGTPKSSVSNKCECQGSRRSRPVNSSTIQVQINSKQFTDSEVRVPVKLEVRDPSRKNACQFIASQGTFEISIGSISFDHVSVITSNLSISKDCGLHRPTNAVHSLSEKKLVFPPWRFATCFSSFFIVDAQISNLSLMALSLRTPLKQILTNYEYKVAS